MNGETVAVIGPGTASWRCPRAAEVAEHVRAVHSEETQPDASVSQPPASSAYSGPGAVAT